jgi:hypothetical protein
MRATLLPVLGLLIAAAPVPAPPKDAARPAAPAAAAQAEPLPTVEQIRKLLDDGNGADALKHVNRLLALRGKAGESYDKYELLTLKGEAHLRLKANEAAAVAFRQAAAETEDRQHKAVARATEQLIRRSKNLAYTPKKLARGEKAEPIDVVNPDSRHKAISALFVDEVSPLLPKAEAAKAARSVGPMIKAMAAAREMEYLELAANGSADQINGIVEGLKEQGKSMLTRVMEKATKRVDRITTLANDTERVRQVIPMSGGGYRSVMIEKRRGVQKDDITELKGIIDACDEVIAQANALAESTGGEEREVEDLVEAADDLKVHVQRMLRVHDVEYKGRREGQDL